MRPPLLISGAIRQPYFDNGSLRSPYLGVTAERDLSEIDAADTNWLYKFSPAESRGFPVA
jgi:hypothetical protein